MPQKKKVHQIVDPNQWLLAVKPKDVSMFAEKRENIAANPKIQDVLENK